MLIKIWLPAAALAVAAFAGSAAQADLFDRLRDSRDRSGEAADKDGREGFRFEIADASELGRIVSPVSFQPLAAPGSDPALTPIPEPMPVPTPPAPVPVTGYGVEGFPAPGIPFEGAPYAGPISPIGPGLPGEGFPLFPRVKYEDLDHIHPCAVPTVVQVLDPCSPAAKGGLFGRHHRDDCTACGPQCVYVEICVPPGCPEIKVSRGGRKVKYDYGDYKVEIESKDGVVFVDYDD